MTSPDTHRGTFESDRLNVRGAINTQQGCEPCEFDGEGQLLIAQGDSLDELLAEPGTLGSCPALQRDYRRISGMQYTLDCFSIVTGKKIEQRFAIAHQRGNPLAYDRLNTCAGMCQPGAASSRSGRVT